MKKYFMIALAAFSLTLTSCKKDVKEQAQDYAEQMVDAMMKGDQEKMMKLSNEADEWMKNLSPEEKKEANEVFEKAGQEAAEKMLKQMMGSAGDSVAGAMHSAAGAIDAAADAVDAAADAVDAAADDLDEAADKDE